MSDICLDGKSAEFPPSVKDTNSSPSSGLCLDTEDELNGTQNASFSAFAAPYNINQKLGGTIFREDCQVHPPPETLN